MAQLVRQGHKATKAYKVCKALLDPRVRQAIQVRLVQPGLSVIQAHRGHKVLLAI